MRWRWIWNFSGRLCKEFTLRQRKENRVRLQNKHAVVTGAAKGMGSAITLTLAREGADVFLTSRDTTALEEVAAAVRKLGRKAEVCACDVVEDSSVASMVEKAKAFFSRGKLDDPVQRQRPLLHYQTHGERTNLPRILISILKSSGKS